MHATRGRLLIAVIGVAFVVILGTLAVAMSRGIGGADDGRSDVRDRQYPPFALNRFDGTSFDLREAPGPVFVYFWASWCVPCQEEAPVIEKLWPEYQKRGYTFVGVNMWDTESDARRFLERQRLSFPVVADANGRVYVDYGVSSLPDSFFLLPGFRAQARYQGPMTEATLRGLLDELERPDLRRTAGGA